MCRKTSVFALVDLALCFGEGADQQSDALSGIWIIAALHCVRAITAGIIMTAKDVQSAALYTQNCLPLYIFLEASSHCIIC